MLLFLVFTVLRNAREGNVNKQKKSSAELFLSRDLLPDSQTKITPSFGNCILRIIHRPTWHHHA